ncbi:MAG TPA: NAD(P)H-dependent oxidoreductase [Candidatus Saccharimonadales bacterium]
MNVAVVVGTTRDGRVTPKLAKLVEKSLREKHDDVSVLDLAEFEIPMLSEAPWMPDRVLTEGTKKWLDALAKADAYVIVTGEYNHGIPAVLKNALDYTQGELRRKPVGIVSHGVVGGARSAEHLRLVLASKIAASVVPDSVTFHGHVDAMISDEGELTDEHHNGAALDAHLDDVLWYAKALKDARA